MQNLNGILSQIGSLAGTLAPMIIPGAGAIAPLIKGAESLSAAYASFKEANGGQAPADAEANHRKLVDKVNAHADGTLGNLESGG